ncbi:RHS repeat domain-containing protein [Microvirga aerilata]|uniref:RHS repeat domain-containing protein n=1 Tax=Microvirga aerilata TaxID=670292 RepID=UPI00362AD1A9
MTRDALGHDTAAAYDVPYLILPTTITDAVGLQTAAVHDYRLLQPKRVVDPNGHATQCSLTPLGLLKELFVHGRDGEGDSTRPSLSIEYGLHAFEHSAPGNPKPIFTHTRRRVHHETDTDVPQSERDIVLESYEYSDGFGRIMQVRSQADDLLYGDAPFGAGNLSGDQTVAPWDLAGRSRAAADPPNVLVSGAQVYDNKGRPVERYEPFYSTGWQFVPPDAESVRLGHIVFNNRCTTYYDAIGRAVQMINPDGSEQRVVTGVPGSIAAPNLNDPDDFEPTPWEAYSYDANDNAGRTHPTTSLGYRHHWNTPSSVLIDSLGRTVETVARHRRSNGAPVEELRTTSTYDVRGNVLSITDTLGRRAVHYLYDYANRRLRLASPDAGIRMTVYDAAGQKIEYNDARGARTFVAYDRMNRESRVWARDSQEQQLTLRVRTEYGDGGTPAQPAVERAAQRDANRLGKVFRQYDEAGLLTFRLYDFKGQVLDKSRQVIRDEVMLVAFSAPPADWHVPAFRSNWQPPSGIKFETYAAAQLDPTQYETSATHDALGRVKSLVYPRDVEGRRRTLVPRYNRAGAIEKITLDGQVYVEFAAYNNKGQRLAVVYGNGLLTTYAHDPHTSRLKRCWTGRYQRLAGPAPIWRPIDVAEPVQDLAYEHDLVGNVIRISDRTPGSGVIDTLDGPDALHRLFEYDSVYRLVRATGRESTSIGAPRPWADNPWGGFNSGGHGTPGQNNAPQLTRAYAEEYRYDPSGNLVSLRHSAGTSTWVRRFGIAGFGPAQWQQQWASHFATGEAWENATGDRLTHAIDPPVSLPQTHFFDVGGNLVEETTARHFEWDHDDRLKAFRVQSGTGEPSLHTQYLYDVSGQRVKKLTRRQGGTVSTTTYIGGIIEYHRRISGTTIHENNSLHILEAQKRVAVIRIGSPFPDDASPAVIFHLGDLRSANVAVDTTGAWVNREEYTPFGETTFGGFARKRFRYCGKERDEESGLTYHGLRYYAPGCAVGSAATLCRSSTG